MYKMRAKAERRVSSLNQVLTGPPCFSFAFCSRLSETKMGLFVLLEILLSAIEIEANLSARQCV